MKNSMKLPSAPEHQIQTQIISYLRIKGYYVMRLNSGKYAVGEGKNRRFVMGQEAGTPDLVAFRDKYKNSEIELLFIEVKRPGKEATPLQEAKMRELTDYGARCIIATSVDDLREKLYEKYE